MFGIFVHYSTRPIYDVSMNLFCWPPSVDIFNILPGFLWQPLLTWSVANLKLKFRSGYKAVDCSRTNKNAEWRIGESSRLSAHQCGLGSNPGVTPYIYVGWVCCWFSSLLREGFLRVFRFSLSSKIYTSKFHFDLERTDTFRRLLENS